ncbi:UDP-N-acetylglucosamine-dolichyl-phosphate N-acetylglucosaminephosphotransferase [Pseudohyphozyma bogoriensis]|nr:UDP-N-acetylglucosamine-dolichyl-phosphate N-acetylglucosaminephosphotransferase [Pseudohyphozyma bogoriensis]
MGSNGNGAAEPLLTLCASLAISGTAYVLTARLVPLLGDTLVAKGLGGRDMLKRGFRRDVVQPDGTKKGGAGVVLPEATGVIGASVYVLLLTLFAPLPFISHLSPTRDPDLTFPHHSFATYLASLLSLLTATFLGFLDDVFDIRWRFKVPIPVIASVPLLVTYAAGSGITDIVLPKTFGLRALFNVESTSGVIHLGPLYYLYMSLLSTFCTNSINILAGVNGVEVSQALIITLSILLNDLLYLTFDFTPFLALLGFSSETRYTISAGLARGSQELQDRHLFSLYFMLPLVGVCFGLLKHNWYPARSFIGDTFCYFSGMAFAVVGILSHFSKTLLLFFIPQIFNFVYSLPQLAGIVPCPRHRLPTFDEKTGLLGPSYASFAPDKPAPKGALKLILRLLGKIGLVDVVEEKGEIVKVSNLTILNLLLITFGNMKEESLTSLMMAVQVGGSAIAFGVRYGGAGWFYGEQTQEEQQQQQEEPSNDQDRPEEEEDTQPEKSAGPPRPPREPTPPSSHRLALPWLPSLEEDDSFPDFEAGNKMTSGEASWEHKDSYGTWLDDELAKKGLGLGGRKGEGMERLWDDEWDRDDVESGFLKELRDKLGMSGEAGLFENGEQEEEARGREEGFEEEEDGIVDVQPVDDDDGEGEEHLGGGAEDVEAMIAGMREVSAGGVEMEDVQQHQEEARGGSVDSSLYDHRDSQEEREGSAISVIVVDDTSDDSD